MLLQDKVTVYLKVYLSFHKEYFSLICGNMQLESTEMSSILLFTGGWASYEKDVDYKTFCTSCHKNLVHNWFNYKYAISQVMQLILRVTLCGTDSLTYLVQWSKGRCHRVLHHFKKCKWVKWKSSK